MDVPTASLAYYHDIQNVPFPPNKDPKDCVRKIRETFRHWGSEEEFVVACDVKKEKDEILDALDYLKVNPKSARKESADKVLEGFLKKFAASHKAGLATVVLISSDEGFRTQVSDLKFKHLFRVILLHGNNVTPDFLKFPDEAYNFYELLDELPDVEFPTSKTPLVTVKAKLMPLPAQLRTQRFSMHECEMWLSRIFRCRSVMYDADNMTAKLKFDDMAAAYKARKAKDMDCYGHPIELTYPECAKWRATGVCENGDHCSFFHFPEMKGVEETVTDSETTARSVAQVDKLHRKECRFHRGRGCGLTDEQCPDIHNSYNNGADLKQIDCRYGSQCWSKHCLFKHPDDSNPKRTATTVAHRNKSSADDSLAVKKSLLLSQLSQMMADYSTNRLPPARILPDIIELMKNWVEHAVVLMSCHHLIDQYSFVQLQQLESQLRSSLIEVILWLMELHSRNSIIVERFCELLWKIEFFQTDGIVVDVDFVNPHEVELYLGGIDCFLAIACDEHLTVAATKTATKILLLMAKMSGRSLQWNSFIEKRLFVEKVSQSIRLQLLKSEDDDLIEVSWECLRYCCYWSVLNQRKFLNGGGIGLFQQCYNKYDDQEKLVFPMMCLMGSLSGSFRSEVMADGNEGFLWDIKVKTNSDLIGAICFMILTRIPPGHLLLGKVEEVRMKLNRSAKKEETK